MMDGCVKQIMREIQCDYQILKVQYRTVVAVDILAEKWFVYPIL